MSLIIKNQNSNTSTSLDYSSTSDEYTCIGSYEDKPTNCVYYFLHSNDNMGVAGKYDCIVEYNQLDDKTRLVYQDGRPGSNGVTDQILNYSKSHLITGVNKVEDFLYWTDNLNRPRKIDVEKSKRNEEYIKLGPTFQGILKQLSLGEVFSGNNAYVIGSLSGQDNTILVGVSNNHPFLKNDHLYLNQRDTVSPSQEGRGYNGYCKSLGIIKSFDESTSNVSVQEGSKTLTAQGVDPTDGLDRGDYICIVKNSTTYVFEIDYIINNFTLELTESSPITATETTSFNLSSSNPNLNTENGIITSTPFIDNYPTSDGGKVLMAQPEDAYSPLISYGAREDKIKYLDALSHQPKDKPFYHFSDDGSKVNHLVGKFFQFRFRYIYDDGTVSAYSGISNVANQEGYARSVSKLGVKDVIKLLDNTINIEYQDFTSNVEKIEIVARDGNDGEFFLVDVVKNNFIKYLKKRKNEDLFSTSALFFGGVTQKDVQFSSTTFKNNGVYSFVDPVDLGKLQDHLPKRAKAQTVLPKNRIAYGNVVDGYDNTDIYCNLVVNESGYLTDQEQEFNFSVEDPTQGGPSEDVKFSLVATSKTDSSNKNFSSIIDIDGSLGDKPIKINVSWTKLLYQNHNQNPDAPTSFVPRSGKLSLNTSVRSPQSAEDVALKVVEAINNSSYEINPESFNFDYVTSSEVISGNINPMVDLGFGSSTSVQTTKEFFSAPTSISADYNNSTGHLSINLVYSKDLQKSETNDFLQILGSNSYQTSSSYNPMPSNSGSTSDSNSYYKDAFSFGRSYKTGANHSFGLVYYDETNRASFVNRMKPVNNYNSGTEIYSPFYTESHFNQSSFNSVFWNIYHRPPMWATHYQWVYSGNTSVDEFIQIPIQNTYKGNSDDKIYLGLGSLKGLDLSYNEENPSLIDYNFVEGDRVRFISFGGSNVGTDGFAPHEGSRNYFKKYIDVPIISMELYDETEIAEVTVSEGSNPIGGHYIVISDPSEFDDSGAPIEIPISDANSSYSSNSVNINYSNVSYVGIGNAYNRLVVEIYRPKKTVSTDSSEAYYEVGHKMEIQNPGTGSRTHQGQSDDFFFDEESGIEVTAVQGVSGPEDENGNFTTNFGSGVLNQGDVYVKPRRISHFKQSEAHVRELTIINCESYYLSDFYNSNNWNKGRLNIENPYSEERRLSASVYYSDVFSSTTNYNGLSTFNMDDEPFYDYNQDFGSIQSLMVKGDDLIIFHENKVARALVGKNILNYADGDSNLAVSSKVLDNYAQVYSGNNGCSLNPESIVKYKDRFYFVDIKRGAVLRLGGDGLTRISDYGLSDYIRDLGEVYIMTNPEESTDGEFKIVAGYDPKYDEYVVTFPSMLDYNDSEDSGLWSSSTSNWEISSPLINNLQPERSLTSKTISFNDNIKKWTSFYSYKPEFYGRINRQFLTYKNGRLYKQNSPDSSNFNTFYGVRYNSNIEFPFNAEPSSVKSYNAISLESDTKLLTDVSTNMGQYNNSYDSVISTEIGYRSINGYVYSVEDSPYCLYGKDGVNFYEDVSPGDLIKIIVDDTPHHNIVKNVLTKNKITLDSPVSSVFDDQTAEVIDYKTKEGIQYSQIPFAPSKTDIDYQGNFQSENSGDASNMFGLGTYRANIDFFTYIGVIENVQGSVPFVGNKLISASDQIPGAKYGTLGQLKYPEEYSLYSLDNETGESSHAGWVYDITGNNIKFKATGYHSMIYTGPVFYFIVREGLIDGEKLKGHYLKTNLKSHWYQSKYKFNLYGANVDVDKSELSNK